MSILGVDGADGLLRQWMITDRRTACLPSAGLQSRAILAPDPAITLGQLIQWSWWARLYPIRGKGCNKCEDIAKLQRWRVNANRATPARRMAQTLQWPLATLRSLPLLMEPVQKNVTSP